MVDSNLAIKKCIAGALFLSGAELLVTTQQRSLHCGVLY